MKRSPRFHSAWCVASVAMLSLLSAVTAQGQTAPARVNTNSIRTANGQPLLRPVGQNVQPASHNGYGFFHYYQSQSVARNNAPTSRLINAAVTQQQAEAQVQQEQLPPGEPVPAQVEAGPQVDFGIPSPSFIDQGPMFDPSCDSCGGKGGCKTCNTGLAGLEDWNWACVCVPLPPLDNLSFNAGVQGFKNPIGSGYDGSFGFQAGVNLGAPMPLCEGLGWQVGLRGASSNLNGSSFIDTSERNQLFFTAGLFHRVDWGLQWGIVYDKLSEDWFYDQTLELSQVRGEVSWVFQGCSEVGFFFFSSVDTDDNSARNPNAPPATRNFGATTSDIYALFYRHRFDDCGCSYARAYLGVSGDRDYPGNLVRGPVALSSDSSVILGADAHIEFSPNCALETGFTYLMPSNSGLGSAAEETWNIGINLVWYPFGSTCGTPASYYRPLFNVADNGSMLVDFNGPID